MHKVRPMLTRVTSATLLLALLAPFPVLADPSVTVNGVNLPHSAPFASTLVASSTVLTDPWSVFVLYDADQPAAPTARDGTPSFDFTNGIDQTIGDCGDDTATTWCFTYTPPSGIEAAVFWYFDILNAGGTYRFIADTAGPILSILGTTSESLPTINGDSSYGSAAIAVTIASATTTRVYQTQAEGGFWSYTLQTGDELPSATYTVSVVGTDQYNNLGDAATTTLVVPPPPFVPDTTAPTVAEESTIGTTTDTTPDYSFTSDEAGTLSFASSCTSATDTVNAGTTTLTFDTLVVGTYADCSIGVTDSSGNTGSTTVTAFTIEAIPAPPEPTPEPEPAPAPAPSGGGGGGGGFGGVISGPLSVGYQTPYTPPPAPAPAPPEPQPVQTTVSAPVGTVSVATPPAAVPTQTPDTVQAVSEVQTIVPEPVVARAPATVVTPWDTPAGEQINTNLAAAAATTGFHLPNWILLAVLLILAILGITAWTLRRRREY